MDKLNTELLIPIQSKSRDGAAKAIFATTLGNGLEFFDLVLFAFFSTFIANAYFPSDDPLISMMSTFAVFGVGYLSRPLGALLIGNYADKKGRKPAMALTFSLMALSTLAIGIIPSYHTMEQLFELGWLAPMLVVIARLVQGFSAGGEFGASTTLLVEYAQPHNRGFYGGWQIASQGAGNLMAALAFVLITFFFTPIQVEEEGWWRLPFVFGVVIAPIGLYIRSKLEETGGEALLKQTMPLEKKKQLSANKKNRLPIMEVCVSHYKTILACILLTAGGTVSHTIILFYLPNHAISILGLEKSYSMVVAVIAGIITLIGGPLAGAWSDRRGRKRVIIGARLGILALIYPAFWALNMYPSLTNFFIIMVLLSTLNVIAASPAITIMTELFPRHVRTSAISLVYSIGVTVFGGFTLLIAASLVKFFDSPNAPAYYTFIAVLISTLSLGYIRETYQDTLD